MYSAVSAFAMHTVCMVNVRIRIDGLVPYRAVCVIHRMCSCVEIIDPVGGSRPFAYVSTPVRNEPSAGPTVERLAPLTNYDHIPTALGDAADLARPRSCAQSPIHYYPRLLRLHGR